MSAKEIHMCIKFIRTSNSVGAHIIFHVLVQDAITIEQMRGMGCLNDSKWRAQIDFDDLFLASRKKAKKKKKCTRRCTRLRVQKKMRYAIGVFFFFLNTIEELFQSPPLPSVGENRSAHVVNYYRGFFYRIHTVAEKFYNEVYVCRRFSIFTVFLPAVAFLLQRRYMKTRGLNVIFERRSGVTVFFFFFSCARHGKISNRTTCASFHNEFK